MFVCVENHQSNMWGGMVMAPPPVAGFAHRVLGLGVVRADGEDGVGVLDTTGVAALPEAHVDVEVGLRGLDGVGVVPWWSGRAKKVLGLPKRCELAHAFMWECSYIHTYNRLTLAPRLGQHGAFLTAAGAAHHSPRSRMQCAVAWAAPRSIASQSVPARLSFASPGRGYDA